MVNLTEAPLPTPTITLFSGTIKTVIGRRMLNFQWATNNANYCTLSTAPTIQQVPSSPPGGYQIPMLPLEATYTLTAVNNYGTATSTLNLTWTATDIEAWWSTNPLDITIAPDGSRLYVANDTNITVITPTRIIPITPSLGGIISYFAAIAVSPDGNSLYYAFSDPNRGFIVGMLQASNMQAIGFESQLPTSSTVYNLAVWPDNSRIYLADRIAQTITVFKVELDSSIPNYPLSPVGSPIPIPNVLEVRVSPDGSYLYVLTGHTIEAYLPRDDPRNPLSHANSYSLRDQDAQSVGFAPGIAYPAALSNSADQVILFDASTMNIEGQPVVPPFEGTPFLVVEAPDGSYIYVAYDNPVEHGRTISKLVPSGLSGGTT